VKVLLQSFGDALDPSMKKTKKPVKPDNKVIDLEGKLKRSLADYANLERRCEKEREEFIKFSNTQLLRKFLEIFDELQMCECHLKDKGLTLICDKFRELLKSESVAKISAEGEEFNPQTMEAVEMVPGERNRVLEVLRDGYTIKGKIIRPAKVRVGDGNVNK